MSRRGRPDRHLVDLLALDAVEVDDADDGLVRLPAPGVVAGPVRAWKRTGLSHGWPSRTHAELLGDLALEQVDLRAVGRQRGERVARERVVADAQQRPARRRRGRRRAPTASARRRGMPKSARDALARARRRRRPRRGSSSTGELREPSRAAIARAVAQRERAGRRAHRVPSTKRGGLAQQRLAAAAGCRGRGAAPAPARARRRRDRCADRRGSGVPPRLGGGSPCDHGQHRRAHADEDHASSSQEQAAATSVAPAVERRAAGS